MPPPFRAPRESGQWFCWPPLATVVNHLTQQTAALPASDARWLGRSTHELAAAARRELWQAAFRYTTAYLSPDGEITHAAEKIPPPPAPQRIVLSGHQAELYHPGVWAKHFYLRRIAAATGATAIHLIVDSDLLKQPGVWVPTGDRAAPIKEFVRFDQPPVGLPLESWRLVDVDLWESFGERVCAALEPWRFEPLMREIWPAVVAETRAGTLPAYALGRVRHGWEQLWARDQPQLAASTWEVPLSVTCGFESFVWFVATILDDLPRYATIYNRALHDYRVRRRLRSATHPAPALACDGAWWETPFWLTRAESAVRHSLYVSMRPGERWLSDRHGWSAAVPWPPVVSAERAVERLCELFTHEAPIRPRALTTTTWARLLLGDLFIHGIGGAKYDEVTEVVNAEFFGLTTPEYQVVTATLRLPIPHAANGPVTLSQVERELRELRYHPERFLPQLPLLDASDGRLSRPAEGPASASDVAEKTRCLMEKRRWIQTPKTPENAAERHRAIESANQALQSWVDPIAERLRQERETLRQAERAEETLGSREYAAVLFPAETVQSLLTHPPESDTAS